MSGGIIPLLVPNTPDALVIGGGIAGLCAAVDLIERGWTVTLAEQKPRLGGRAYSFIHPDSGDEVDNGQHLMLGCYHHTLRLIETLGTMEHCSILEPLAINFKNVSDTFDMRAPALPAPLHMLGALAGLRTLTLRERVGLLRILPSLMNTTRSDARFAAMTVSDWLDATHQSDAARQRLWNILAVGMLNERPDRASAAHFIRILRTILFGSRRDASVVLPRRGLSRIFADPAAQFIRSHRGRVLLKTPVSDLRIEKGRVVSARVGNEMIEPRVVISAVPHSAIFRCFADGSRSFPEGLVQAGSFEDVPIVSIHLWFDTFFMHEEFTALLDSPIDWVFNRTMIAAPDARRKGGTEGPMMLSLVVSAARPLAALSKQAIIETALCEVRRQYPGATNARLRHALVVKEKRATFSPVPGIDRVRPPTVTSVGNFFLAGDWTDTKLPATIEGAAQSGYRAAAEADAWLSLR